MTAAPPPGGAPAAGSAMDTITSSPRLPPHYLLLRFRRLFLRLGRRLVRLLPLFVELLYLEMAAAKFSLLK